VARERSDADLSLRGLNVRPLAARLRPVEVLAPWRGPITLGSAPPPQALNAATQSGSETSWHARTRPEFSKSLECWPFFGWHEKCSRTEVGEPATRLTNAETLELSTEEAQGIIRAYFRVVF
jgi:hypothetical protein